MASFFHATISSFTVGKWFGLFFLASAIFTTSAMLAQLTASISLVIYEDSDAQFILFSAFVIVSRLIIKLNRQKL